ncbi:insulinoma-associated protein 1-like [Eucalyptus grandis]|uniref:insulinoma-associated protein 1-like n=1 Tax=Eucalyptus grandis TaxID=71139 RepID=UPI00192EB5FA|nr:insulinoma-associated protein 1-like [Eucalyptus grandis]
MEVEAGATVTFSENAYRIRRYQAPSRLTLNDDRIRGRKSPTAALRASTPHPSPPPLPPPPAPSRTLSPSVPVPSPPGPSALAAAAAFPAAGPLIDDETGERFIVWGGSDDPVDSPAPPEDVLRWKPARKSGGGGGGSSGGDASLRIESLVMWMIG